MTEYRSIIDILQDVGAFDQLPDGLEPAIKFVNPDWTTYGGFSWWQPGRRWIASPDTRFDPETCTSGGLHVANTVAAAQSGGASLSHCLAVGVKPSEAGKWDEGKRKARRVYVVGPVDLVGAVRRNGAGTNLAGANLAGSDLAGRYLPGANLARANLAGTNLYKSNLEGTNLEGANLAGTILAGANLADANLADADLPGANLARANLEGTNLEGTNLFGTYLEGHDLDDLRQRGATL